MEDGSCFPQGSSWDSDPIHHLCDDMLLMFVLQRAKERDEMRLAVRSISLVELEAARDDGHEVGLELELELSRERNSERGGWRSFMSHVVIRASHASPRCAFDQREEVRRDIMNNHDQPGCSEISTTEIMVFFQGSGENSVKVAE